MKTMNLFASELQNYGLTTDDFRPASNPEIEKVSSVFGELCEVVELYNVSFYDGKYYPEHATVHVIYDGYIMRPYCRYNEKSFEFSTHTKGQIILRTIKTKMSDRRKSVRQHRKNFNRGLTI